MYLFTHKLFFDFDILIKRLALLSLIELFDMSGPGRTARYGYTTRKRVEFTPENLDEVDYQATPIEYTCAKIANYNADEDEGYLQIIPLATPLPIPCVTECVTLPF